MTRARTKLLMLIRGEVGRRTVALLEGIPALELVTSGPDLSRSDLEGLAPDVVALVTPRPRPAVAARLDEVCWSTGIPWLQAELLGHQFRVGPVVIPHVTPCWECSCRRQRSLAVDLPAHRAVEAAARSESSEPWLEGELGALTEQVAALTALECLAVSSGRYAPPPHAMGQYWEGDAIFGVLRHRRFARIGRCTRCAPRAADDDGHRHLAECFGRRFVPREPQP